MNSTNAVSARSTGQPRARIFTVQFVCLVVFTLITVMARFNGAWIAMVLALAAMLFSREKARFPATFWWGVALLGWALISSFLAMSPALAFATLDDRLKVMLIFLVALNAIRCEKQLWIYLLIYAAAFLVYPARGTLLNFAHGITTNYRVSWNYIYDNPNDDAGMALLATGVALSIGMAAVQSPKIRWATMGCAAIFALVVLVTQSRGALIGLVVALLPPFVRAVKRRSVFFIAVAIVVVGVGLSVLPHKFWVRMEGLKDLTSVATISKADQTGSAEQRWQIQKTALQIFIDHPILGVGLGCYNMANAEYRPDLGPRDAHDTYLRLAAELGLPGLLLWAALVISVLKHVKWAERSKSRLQSVDPRWLKYGLLAFLTEGIFGSYSDLAVIYLVLGTMWSAAAMIRSQALPEQAAQSVARTS